jgi:hypothetical protein
MKKLFWHDVVLAVPTEVSMTERIPQLNNYLSQLLETMPILTQPIFLEFIDVPRKGIPGTIPGLTSPRKCHNLTRIFTPGAITKLGGNENVLFQLLTR